MDDERQLRRGDFDGRRGTVGWAGEQRTGGRAASEVAKRDGLGEAKTPRGARELADGLLGIVRREERPARVNLFAARRDESAEPAIHVAHTLDTRDDFLADVAALCVIDVCAVE